MKTSEDALLARINHFFPLAACAADGTARTVSSRIPAGRGDDCAVVCPEKPLCISTDLFMEDVHFRRTYFTPEAIGWKSLAVNLSDLAACGARPVGFTLGLALPPDADTALVDGLCRGMAELAEQAQAPLLGGDLSRAERLHLCLTVFGEAAVPLRRGVALPGDILFLIGQPGLARAGLELLERHGREAEKRWPTLCAAHLHPVPLLAEGRQLAALAEQWATETEDSGLRIGLMDVSDGLARDLPRLLGQYGADVSLPPPHPELLAYLDKSASASLFMAQGGEDFILLGSCPPSRIEALHQHLPVTAIGLVSATPGIRLDGVALSGGFDHFASSSDTPQD